MKTEREEQAKRDLARLDAEREKLFHPSASPAASENDPMEVLGKRIARILGPLIAAGLLLYLLVTYLPRA
jgi:hypothetical protein